MPGLFETFLAERAAVFLSFSNFTRFALEYLIFLTPKVNLGLYGYMETAFLFVTVITTTSTTIYMCMVSLAALITRDTETHFFLYSLSSNFETASLSLVFLSILRNMSGRCR